MSRWPFAVALLFFWGLATARGDDPLAVERGRKALLGRNFTGVMWSRIVDDGEAAAAGGGVGVDVGAGEVVGVGPPICRAGACGID